MSKYTSTIDQSSHSAIARKQVKTTGNEITAKIPLKTSTVKQTTTKSAISSETKTTTAVATIPKKQTMPKVLCKPHYGNSHLETGVCKWEAPHWGVV